MKLFWTIHPTTTKDVSPQEWKWGAANGKFREHGGFEEKNQVLTVTFRPVVYIKKGLSAAEKTKVLQHEKKHEGDFRRLALALKLALEQKIRMKKDLEIGKRWDWFQYDLCEAGNTLHRQEMKAGAIGNWMEVCEMPNGPRPQ